MEGIIVFGRQWHAPGSQEGLKDSALKIERLISEHEFSKAKTLLLKSQELNNKYRKRLYRRIENVENLKYESSRGVKKPIRISWHDFWPDMDKYNNQLLDFIQIAVPELKFRVVDEKDESDLNISSCYGNSYANSGNSSALQLLFLGENVRPSYTLYDYTITSDLGKYRGRNCYLPLWILEIDWFKKDSYTDRKPESLNSITEGFTFEPKDRNGRIAFVGNNQEPFRVSFINELINRGIKVDLYGSHTKPIDDKKRLYSNYSCIISFENGYSPGYITEKLIHGFQSKTPLIYYGCLEGSILENTTYPMIMHPAFDIDRKISEIKKLISAKKPVYYEPLVSFETVSSEFMRTKHSIRSMLKQFIF